MLRIPAKNILVVNEPEQDYAEMTRNISVLYALRELLSWRRGTRREGAASAF
jgi:hypothetical protein